MQLISVLYKNSHILMMPHFSDTGLQRLLKDFSRTSPVQLYIFSWTLLRTFKYAGRKLTTSKQRKTHQEMLHMPATSLIVTGINFLKHPK